MDEAVTHYINSHQTDEGVHVDANTLALNVQDDGGGRVAIMHSQTYSTSLCRQVSVGEVSEGQWGEELMDPDCRLAALMAHITQQSRGQLQQPHHKIQTVRGDVDTSVILDNSMRLFSNQALDQSQEPIVVQVPALPPMPPLQQMKRCQEDWFNNKPKTNLKDESTMVTESNSPVLELNPGSSPAQKQQSKKSLPHKKRISRKLKKNNGSSTPQQVTSYNDIVVINCAEDVQQEEILPDNFVTAVQHQDLRPEDTHDIAHEVVRPIFICQICGEFYGEEQLKFFQHLKHHYEPHNTIIIENPVTDLGIDKMTSSCIVDNVAILPDSIVELSLENSVPKTINQTIDKHVLYTTSDKTLNYTTNKVQYSMASMDKEPTVATEVEKADLYDTLDKLELYSCVKCSKTFRKQKQCEAHMKEAHSKLEDMGEFSEPEDLMEGIHVAVDEGGEHYEQSLLPHLTVENGHAHQENTRHWYGRSSSQCSSAAYCGVCADHAHTHAHTHAHSHSHTQTHTHTHPTHTHAPAHTHAQTQARERPHSPQQLKVLKEEVLQRILETDVANDNANFSENIINDLREPIPIRAASPRDEDSNSKDATETKKKGQKRFECPQCGRVFHHRNSLLYHILSHGGKQQVCRDCGKAFYTVTALKIHRRVHNGDRPYKCEVCGRDFRQWSDLKYHKASIHSNQKMFKCEFCDKEFARKYSLSVHRRIHTGERNYKCEYCSKTFRASSYRLSHMRTHTSVKPHKCSQCEKCFRVAADLRRHMLIHDKVRNRLNEQKTKGKEPRDRKQDKIEDKPIKVEVTNKTKKVAVASTTKMPNNVPLNTKNCVKKPSKPVKKNHKKGAPNVTIDQLDTNYTNNVEVFDTRQEPPYTKFKEVYNETGYIKDDLDNAFDKQVICYKALTEDRDFAILRPMYRNNVLIDNVEAEKGVFRENTDGKMQVYTQVEKKDFNNQLPSSQVALSDMRHLEREVRNDIHGETIENGFIERLTALYNIPAV
ncbi:uncharacterized protein LOC142974083 isoform X2 [Anticarsia gemmatalis]|uniref:uncharacterized protein LOC142974083 isoform X2 n=1 Tax=Anticarsia gemmatalis TaxID=129554 RepID=UPI003F75E606